MKIEIVTPEASLVTGDVTVVTLPGVNGEFQVLNDHAPIVSLLQEGKIAFKGEVTFTEGFENKFTKDKSGVWTLPINSGTMEMKENKVIILAD
jgi:F-type H+-transporting ATPase subunit epsilon